MRSLAVVFAFALLSLPAFSQPATNIRANVPFPFEMAGIQMPAGEYVVPNPVNGPLEVQNTIGKPTAFAIAFRSQPSKREHSGVELVFTKYGERYFLSKVSHINTVFEVVKSKQERELVTSRVVAGLRPETIKIAASVVR